MTKSLKIFSYCALILRATPRALIRIGIKVLELVEIDNLAVLGCFKKLNPFLVFFLFLREVTFDIHKKSPIRAYAATRKLIIND